MAGAGKSLADNVASGERYLERFARDGVQHFIDGAAVPARSGRTFETGQHLTEDRIFRLKDFETPVELFQLAKLLARPELDLAACEDHLRTDDCLGRILNS